MTCANLIFKLTVAILALIAVSSCDPERKKKCEWYLVPEPDDLGKQDENMIPVCARNFVNNRQYCRLQASFDFTKENFERKFRFDDMKVDTRGTFPKTVLDIKYCD